MTTNIKKIIEELFALNEERKQASVLTDEELDAIVDEILNPTPEEEYSEILGHIFICLDNKTAEEVNILPSNIAKVMDNLVIIKKVDSFAETKDNTYITVDGKEYDIPRKYSFSFSFVK